MTRRFNPVLLRHPAWRWIIFSLLAVYATWRLLPYADFSGPDNGFDLRDALIPAAAIEQGGPPRDGISAIDHPRFVAASKARFLQPQDRVLGLEVAGVTRAYPVKILDRHEIVNDTIGSESVVISYCPLCGSGMAFSARIDSRNLDFGVSGLLYNSDVLLYDRQTESLWSQLMGQAVTGPLRGRKLRQIPVSHTRWSAWLRRHPDTQVLSIPGGRYVDYDQSPYDGYSESPAVWFSVAHRDDHYRPKERVIGITLNGASKAYPFVELGRHGAVLDDEIAGQRVQVRFDAENRSGWISDATGRVIPSTVVYWFALIAFHPDTLVYREAKQTESTGSNAKAAPAAHTELPVKPQSR